ncbi:MAG: response regulator [Gammaproteobacteria bacterium]|nr:MAG: response regulator [Gammaproteobacteria bacterium]
MNKLNILIIEDEKKIVQILKDYLEKEGFEVSALYDGNDAVRTLRDNPPDFLILDLMLPGMDGLSICREVRKFSQVPILMLTARVDEIDRLIGLEVGADDYVCKPFLPREVVARVKTILRRIQAPSSESQDEINLTYHDVTLSLDRFQCQVNDRVLELTPVEFRILHVLLAHPGRVYSRERLMESAYPDQRIVSDRTIDSHIKNLRKKLDDVGSGQVQIHSIYGVGYKIE